MTGVWFISTRAWGSMLTGSGVTALGVTDSDPGANTCWEITTCCCCVDNGRGHSAFVTYCHVATTVCRCVNNLGCKLLLLLMMFNVMVMLLLLLLLQFLLLLLVMMMHVWLSVMWLLAAVVRSHSNNGSNWRRRARADHHGCGWVHVSSGYLLGLRHGHAPDVHHPCGVRHLYVRWRWRRHVLRVPGWWWWWVRQEAILRLSTSRHKLRLVNTGMYVEPHIHPVVRRRVRLGVVRPTSGDDSSSGHRTGRAASSSGNVTHITYDRWEVSFQYFLLGGEQEENAAIRHCLV